MSKVLSRKSFRSQRPFQVKWLRISPAALMEANAERKDARAGVIKTLGGAPFLSWEEPKPADAAQLNALNTAALVQTGQGSSHLKTARATGP